MRGLLRWFFIAIACATVLTGRAQEQSRLVTRYGPEQGFTTASVNAIIRDSKGFMWFGTTGGLYRFDGYRFEVFKPSDKDTMSLSDVFIRELFEDSRGNIWIGTLHGGLCRYDPMQNVIKRYHDPRDSIGAGTIIHDMTEDKDGNIWIVGGRGIHRYSYQAGWKRYRFTEKELPKAKRKQPFSIHAAKDGIMWLGCQGRTFMRLEPTTRTVKLYDFNASPLRSALVRSITSDEDGTVWMTAHEGGLLRFDPKTEMHTLVPTIDMGSYWSLKLTRDGILVAGTAGLLSVEKRNFNIKNLTSDAIYGIGPNDVRVVHMEDEHCIWLGTAGNGVYRLQFLRSLRTSIAPFPGAKLYNVVKDKKVHFYSFPKHGMIVRSADSAAQESSMVVRFNEEISVSDAVRDAKGNIWIAGWQGVARFAAKELSKVPNPNFTMVDLPLGRMVASLLEDTQLRIWAGGSGYFLYDDGARAFKEFKQRNGSNVEDMNQTANGLWAALANNGLAQLLPEADTVLRHLHDTKDTSTISNNYVSQLEVDPKGTLWVGTLSGLDRYNPTPNNFTRFRLPAKEGSVYRMDQDNKGNLLIQTKDGLYQFTVPSGSSEGRMEKIQSPINLSHGYGFLHYPWFTWQKGDQIAECHLDSISPTPNPPRMAITGFSLDPHNKNPLSPEDGRTNPAYRTEIELDHDQNLINIEFAALDFSDPSKNEYAYQLEGFDPEWTHSGTRHYVTYTNLDPGEYVFRVKGANAYGVWSTEPATLSITIHPPIWKTTWAYLIYGITGIALLLLARRSTINRERLKAQVSIAEAERKALKDLDQLKTRFFSNITHEFRTPLTLIQGPATELYEKVKDPASRELLRMISSNSNRLLKLINQLLDLARLDAGEMTLQLRDTHLPDFFTARISQFASLAASRNIEYTWKLSDHIPSAMVDEEKLEVIILNLISNALKFTPEGGRVTVNVQWVHGSIQLDVEDTGRGIPEDKLGRIFDRFYQVEPSDASHSEGTGIGLALVKQYVEVMHGKIHVESKPGKGTLFRVTIPAPSGSAVKSSAVDIQGEVAEDGLLAGLEAPLLLLVDDSEEIRTFIKVSLGNQFRYQEARHGRQGLEMAIALLPDLIISDLMMPEMDGLELCSRLKKDKRTDHIPFVMLTAKAAETNKLEGLQTGADEYLVKPFNKAELLVKVQNLITLRNNLQAHIRTAILAQPSAVRAESAEEQFVLKARLYVEAHLKEGSLTVESLAGEMNLSREQCYRKLSALTGMSPSAFIRKIKLHRAHQLLVSKWGTVSQVAYESGFENLSHFSKAFKEEFGKLPSEV